MLSIVCEDRARVDTGVVDFTGEIGARGATLIARVAYQVATGPQKSSFFGLYLMIFLSH